MRLLVLLTVLLLAPPDELGERLADLSAPSALRRSRAQAWIAGHARREDFPRLADAARRGDHEVRGRLVGALSAEDRNLSLAVLFAGESAPELAAIGTRAIGEDVLRWNEGLSEAPLLGAELVRHLRRLEKRDAPPPFSLDLALPLATNVTLLRRYGRLPLGIAVDPGVLTRPTDPLALPRIASGSWADLLVALAKEHGLAPEGYGLGTLEEPLPAAKRWVRLAPLPAAGRESGTDVLARWCLGAARSRGGGSRAQAVRALAASGWPAALAWLEECWLLDQDTTALDGLFLAAATGRVVASLARPERVRELVARADRALARGDGGLPEATELRLVLGQVGCLGSHGESLSPLLFEDWDSRTSRQLWWRLAVLEQTGCRLVRGGGSERRVRALCGDPGSPPELRLQALRAWCKSGAGGGEPLVLAAPRALVERARSLRRARELLALLGRAGLQAPDVAHAWADADDATLAFGCAWLFASAPPDASRAADALRRAARGSSVERLFALTQDALDGGRRSVVDAAFRQALAGVQDPALEDLAFRLGLLRGPALEAFRGRSGSLEEEPPRLLAGWAVWGGDAVAQEARDLLMLRLKAALAGPDGRDAHGELIDALQSVVTRLFASGKDPAAAHMVARIRRFLESRAESRLAGDLERLGFPAPPGASPQRLEERARRFDPHSLPG